MRPNHNEIDKRHTGSAPVTSGWKPEMLLLHQCRKSSEGRDALHHVSGASPALLTAQMAGLSPTVTIHEPGIHREGTDAHGV